MMANPVTSCCELGILFPGYCWRVTVVLLTSVLRGSKIASGPPWLLRVCEKSPWRSASVGTRAEYVLGLLTYSCCRLVKKNVRLRPSYSLGIRIGPPTAPE